MTPAEAAGDGDGTNLGEVIAALTEENNRLSRRLERERRIRHAAEQIAEQGLRDLYQRQVRLETLSRLAQQLSAAITAEDVGAVLTAEVLDEAGATALSLGLVDSDDQLRWFTPSVDLHDERTFATDAFLSGRPVIAAGGAMKYAATVGWPLTAAGKPFGVLLLVWVEPQPLDTAQRAFISAVATMVSQALVRARVYSDEHARAAVLRSAVLPHSQVETGGLDVCATYEPADSDGLGGDWYDIMPLPGNRIYLAVGDVVGHGLPAVTDMSHLRAAGRALAHLGLSPGQLLAALNGFTADVSHGKFASMAVAIFDREEGSLLYSTAGHPPPLYRRWATGEVHRLGDAHGPVLGPVRESVYPVKSLAVQSGDMVVMYTDGLVERRGVDLELGIARAVHIVGGWDPGVGVRRNSETLVEALSTRNRVDDLCVVVLQFNSPGHM